MEVSVTEQYTALQNFSHTGRRVVLDHSDIRIEASGGAQLAVHADLRSTIFGLSGMRRNIHADELVLACFAGYALWNCLAAPMLFTRTAITHVKGRPWRDVGRLWR